jgi:hypothetical protein
VAGGVAAAVTVCVGIEGTTWTRNGTVDMM